jgi:hypothetical protein
MSASKTFQESANMMLALLTVVAGLAFIALVPLGLLLAMCIALIRSDTEAEPVAGQFAHPREPATLH